MGSSSADAAVFAPILDLPGCSVIIYVALGQLDSDPQPPQMSNDFAASAISTLFHPLSPNFRRALAIAGALRVLPPSTPVTLVSKLLFGAGSAAGSGTADGCQDDTLAAVAQALSAADHPVAAIADLSPAPARRFRQYQRRTGAWVSLDRLVITLPGSARLLGKKLNLISPVVVIEADGARSAFWPDFTASSQRHYVFNHTPVLLRPRGLTPYVLVRVLGVYLADAALENLVARSVAWTVIDLTEHGPDGANYPRECACVAELAEGSPPAGSGIAQPAPLGTGTGGVLGDGFRATGRRGTIRPGVGGMSASIGSPVMPRPSSVIDTPHLARINARIPGSAVVVRLCGDARRGALPLPLPASEWVPDEDVLPKTMAKVAAVPGKPGLGRTLPKFASQVAGGIDAFISDLLETEPPMDANPNLQ
jgi:hypothetical protein